ncbi:MAG: BLUF domain-containing protein [Pseudomonadota bacterium]
MATDLYQLVYVSRSVIEGDEQSYREQIDEILKVSRENNQRDEITGALLCNRRYFAQVLEGGQDVVQDAYERIQCDERHEQTTVLRFRPVPRRDFGEWTMAYEGHDSDALHSFNRLTQESRLKLEELDGLDLVSLLQAHLQAA